MLEAKHGAVRTIDLDEHLGRLTPEMFEDEVWDEGGSVFPAGDNSILDDAAYLVIDAEKQETQDMTVLRIFIEEASQFHVDQLVYDRVIEMIGDGPEILATTLFLALHYNPDCDCDVPTLSDATLVGRTLSWIRDCVESCELSPEARMEMAANG